MSVRLREAWLVVFARPPGQPTSPSANVVCFKKFSFDFSIYGVFLLQHKIQIQKFLYFSPPSMLKVRKNSFTWASSFAEVLASGRKCCGCILFYSPDRRFIYKILRSSCTRSSITMGLDKKPFMPLSKALRRSSLKALAVMARIGSFARAGSSSARIFRVAV